MSEIQHEGCFLFAFLSGGHQNWTSWVLFLLIFGFVFLSSRYRVALLLQLHSHMTSEYSYYKEGKIQNKSKHHHPPQKKVNIQK